MATDPKLMAECARLCLESPLYSKAPNLEIGDFRSGDVLKYSDFQFDAHCIFCEKGSTFKTSRTGRFSDNLEFARREDIIEANTVTAILACQRDTSHRYFYMFDVYPELLVKIGQRPSMETIAGSGLEKYRSILGKQYFAELHRAGGLISHGIGIGAFVYLRRIFERLIATHRATFEQTHGVIDRFDGMRMDEKIDALKESLPATLVRNRGVYGILSKGLHELDEDTCKKHFTILKAAILAILEEDFQTREKEKAADDLSRAITEVLGEVRDG
jgi:hypothetical protein